MSMKAKVEFMGGVGEATGANFIVRTMNGHSFAVDCGLVQGGEFATDINHAPFRFDAKSVEVLLITHAHMDHIGRIPKLIKEGFTGVIYSTPQTRELADIMLRDAVRLITRESIERRKEPLYSEADVAKAMSLWQIHEYHSEFEFLPGIKARFIDAGHILGSAIIEISTKEGNAIFTGDLGNSPTPLLPDTEVPDIEADFMIIESVYGDRNHESKEERDRRLEQIVGESLRKGGTVVIPSFSIERTQVILYELNDLVEKRKLPKVPVYVDSPLAIAVTHVYKDNADLFKPEVRERIRSGDDIFEFPGLRFVRSSDESHAIHHHAGPKIIIAGSGMSVGGRVIHHEKFYLGDKNAVILLVGYQVAGSLGRKIEDGIKQIQIEGEMIRVHARIEKISGYSSHKDSDHLVEFVGSMKKAPRVVYVAMGEPKSSAFLAQRLRDEIGVNAVCPEDGQSYDIHL
jgi:metallo-beta-lactamase family protein